MIPLRRAFDENRRLVVPVIAGLVLNVVLSAAVVYPLRVRARSADERQASAAQELAIAQSDDAAARGLVLGKDKTGAALEAFYKNVLPGSLATARESTFLRLAQLAEQHHLRLGRRAFKPEEDANQRGSLRRFSGTMALEGDYENVRQFIYELESGSDFIVIDSVALAQGSDPGSPLQLTLALSTYYRTTPHGA
jgi:Type II secretion system (T2SS), protein M subtype b